MCAISPQSTKTDFLKPKLQDLEGKILQQPLKIPPKYFLSSKIIAFTINTYTSMAPLQHSDASSTTIKLGMLEKPRLKARFELHTANVLVFQFRWKTVPYSWCQSTEKKP